MIFQPDYHPRPLLSAGAVDLCGGGAVSAIYQVLGKETIVRQWPGNCAIAAILVLVILCRSQVWAAETLQEASGMAHELEVHETTPILRTETPQYVETEQHCATAVPGRHIIARSVKAQVITARLMDPGGDPDWKVENAEARTSVDKDDTRICLWGYCQGPYLFQCEIQVRASWEEQQ